MYLDPILKVITHANIGYIEILILNMIRGCPHFSFSFYLGDSNFMLGSFLWITHLFRHHFSRYDVVLWENIYWSLRGMISLFCYTQNWIAQTCECCSVYFIWDVLLINLAELELRTCKRFQCILAGLLTNKSILLEVEEGENIIYFFAAEDSSFESLFFLEL